MPSEVLGERWSLRLFQRWPSADAAYAMEQRVFGKLHERRTEAELQSAWVACLAS